MGTQPCCESKGNKENLTSTTDPYANSNGIIQENASLKVSQNNTKLNAPNNLTSSINSMSLKQSQSLVLSQNGPVSIGQSANSLILNNSINQNMSTRSESFQCIKSFEAHDDKIVSLIELSSHNVASGSYDSTIKIWDINTQQCIQTINETGNVLCLLEFEPNMLLSGTDENIINLWDVSCPTRPVNFFEGHLLWVNCLVKCDEKNFASGSNDSDIRIWNWEKKDCVNILKGHSNCVLTMIKLIDGNLCSGSADLSLKIWDWENATCVKTLTGHTKWVKCVYQLSNGYIISGSDDRTIKVWNNYNCIKDLLGHQKSVRAFCQISNELFASASFDTTIKIWNINDFSLYQNLEGHQANVLCLLLHSSGFLISCSTDHTIKIWKI